MDLNTLSEMRQLVRDDLNVDSTSTLFSATIIDRAINRSRRKAYSLFRWPELRDAKKTSTIADQEYYDYPDTWQSDSAWRVTVDGERYGEEPDGSPLTFEDFLHWQDEEPESTETKWTTEGRKIFISPTPTTSGNNNLIIWGQKVGDTLDEDADTTIFSHSQPDCNEALVLEAVAILKNKGGQEGSQFLSIEAKQILATAHAKIRQNKMKYEKRQPFFSVPDLFGRSRQKQITGNFD
jgi:hypothetical protein